MIVDDLNKTLPVSNTPPPSASVGSASFAPVSSSSTPSTPNTHSSTSPSLSATHEADSLDKILADLEAQLKAKRDGPIVDEVKKEVQTDLIKSVSSPMSPTSPAPSSSTSSNSIHSPLVVKKPAEIMVEEKHELMNVKSDIKVGGKVDISLSTKQTSPSLSTTSPTSESIKSVAPSPTEHPFTVSPGIAAAQKKVIPETVGAVSVMGISSMKKDTATSVPPSMPGIGQMVSGGLASAIKPKKRNRTGAIVGIALLIFTMVGTAAGISLNWQPGGVFDPRRYAADNMCNVKPGSCTTEEQWISGWYDARKEENKDEVAKQDEYTNARDDQSANQGQQVEIIRHAGEASVGDPGTGNRTGEQATVTNQTITKDAKGNTVISTTLDKNPSSGAAAMGGTGGTGPAQAAAGGGLVIPDISTNQTIGNACNNPSKYKSCSSYQDWVDGYYAAKTDKFKGITATQPEYTDAIKDLDGDPSNGFQSGIIQFNPTTNKFEVTQAFTLSVPDNFKDMSEEDKKKYVQTNHPGIDPAKSFSVAVDANGKVVLTSTGTGSGTSTLPDEWKNGVAEGGGKCKKTADLFCGNGSVGFCVPGGWSGTQTCTDYLLKYGFSVQTGGYAVFDPNPNEISCKGFAAKTDKSYVKCGDGSTYSVCTRYIDGTYKCYPNDPPKTFNSFSVSQNGQCLTSKGAIIAGYYCQGADKSGNTNGCQESAGDFSSGGKTEICVSDIAKNICGVVQIDADYGGGQGKPREHYSINVFSQAGCGGGSKPPTVVIVPPKDNPPCTTCGGPPPSTPPPSPAPPGSPVCVDISASIPSPRLGQAPTFTCSSAAEATRYEFRSKIGSGAYATLAPSTANSNVSSPLTVNASGVYTIQCRPCNANGCANWENL